MIFSPDGDSVRIARQYMDSLLVESRVVGAVRPDTAFSFLGGKYRTPIMTAALSHLDLVSMAEGARQAGAFVTVGMGGNEELGNILATGARVMKVIKPYADEREILSRIEYAEAHGAAAVGMDVEHAANVADPEDSVVVGMQMKQPTLQELEKYIRRTKLPFFIKGALSAADAIRCRCFAGGHPACFAFGNNLHQASPAFSLPAAGRIDRKAFPLQHSEQAFSFPEGSNMLLPPFNNQKRRHIIPASCQLKII